MKRSTIYTLLLSYIVFSCNDASHDHAATNNKNGPDTSLVIRKTNSAIIDTVKKSLPAKVDNKIGYAHFTIRYHSPAVRDRVIWGGLVPFGEIWVTWAHLATSIESDKEFLIRDQPIPAGKYALFTILSNDDWTVILNKIWDQHLTDEYNQADDILRLKIRPDTLSYVQERLMYDIDQWAQKEGNIEFMWERLRIKIPIRVK